jgi:hypothetical protein
MGCSDWRTISTILSRKTARIIEEVLLVNGNASDQDYDGQDATEHTSDYSGCVGCFQ